MANDQVIVDAIKNALTFSDTTSPETIRSLAEQYALACRELNKRMSYCGKYLREGNIAEAIRLAEMEPNLLDAYNILDFEERNEWTNVVATLAFPVPPPLMTDFVRELNDAYSSRQPLEPYLRKYRIAALARAPLADRLTILRTIVRLDPNNLSWVKDQESLEKIRLVDLEAEAANAVRTDDFAKLIELQAECRQNWSIAVPASVTEKIDTTVHRYQMTEVTRQMRDQAELLLQAHAENNVEKAEHACDNLRTLQEWNRFPVPKSIIETTQKAFDWLQNELNSRQLRIKFETTRKQLQNALQKETSQEELSRLHDSLAMTAAEVKLSIPEEIEKTCRQKIGILESRRRRRLLWTATGAVMLCLFLAGAATLLGIYFVETEKTRKTVAALDQLLDEAKPDHIREYFAKNEKSLREMKNGEIVQRVAKLSLLVRQDDSRLAEFEAKRKSFDQSLENGNVPNRLLLNQLERLATTTGEKQSLEALRERLKQIDAKEKNEIDSKLQAELACVQNEKQAVDKNGSLSWESRLKRYGSLVQQLEKARHESAGAGKPLTDRCKIMIDALNDRIGTIQTELALRNRLATLVPLVGNAEHFKNRLKEIADSTLPTERGKPFELAWREFPASEALLRYDVYERRLENFQPNSESANKDAVELLGLYDESAAKFASLSGGNERLISFLKTLAKRPQSFREQAALFSGTRGILTRAKLKPVWALFKSPTEAWYYVTEKPDRSRTYAYQADPSATPVRKTFNETFFQNLPKINLPDYTNKALGDLNGINQTNWTTTCVTMVRDLVEADGVDPIFKYVLLKTMICEFSEYDAVFARHFEPFLALFINPDLDAFTEWMNADLPETQLRRAAAEAVLARIKLPSPETIQKDAAFHDNPGSSPFDRYRWIGFLSRGDSGWQCEHPKEFSTADPTASDLCIARKIPNQDKQNVFELITIGHMRPGGKIELFDDPKMLEGIPVFLKSNG